MMKRSTPGALDIAWHDPPSTRPIMKVMERAFPPEFGEGWNEAQTRSTFLLPEVELVTASRADEVLGFAIMRSVLDETELLMLAVDPVARRRKVGSALVEALIKRCIQRGSATLFLEMREENEAVYLYQYYGFKPIGRRKSYYSGPEGKTYDAITMSRLISG